MSLPVYFSSNRVENTGMRSVVPRRRKKDRSTLAALAGIEVPLSACRAQVSVYGRPEGHQGPHPVVLDFAHASPH